MTRKDFVLLAETIAETLYYSGVPLRAMTKSAEYFADALRTTNDRFDRGRFEAAVHAHYLSLANLEQAYCRNDTTPTDAGVTITATIVDSPEPDGSRTGVASPCLVRLSDGECWVDHGRWIESLRACH